MDKKVRTRYAPSPTGYLHIGGARTALFSYLYAKHFNGDFVLRIEDTDFERSVVGGEESQINNLEWLGIIPDESPINPKPKYGKYRQSEKLEEYNQIINELLKNNHAYKAYDNAEELANQKEESDERGIPSFRYDKNWLKIDSNEISKRDASGEYSIRLSLKKDTNYEWNDIVRGRISINTNDIGDFVIKKSNGYPTYNFAVVVDDHDMQITDVLRGEEHITNTPKQLAIYDALNWEPPKFGHLTIITNMEGKKLSKRDTSVKQFIEDYKNEGYVPEAIFNFLTLLGWTSKDAKELMPQKEIIEKFLPDRLSKSPSKFDIEKMNWFSKQYLSTKNLEEIKSFLTFDKDEEWINLFIDTFKKGASTYSDLQKEIKIYEDASIKKIELKNVVKVFANELKDFSIEGIKNAINLTKNITNAKGKDLFMPIRLATTYQEHGPELAKSIYLFGKDLIFKRLGIK